MKVVKHSEIPKLRESLLASQHNKCPLCGREIGEGRACLDHQHKKRKSDEPGIDGAGMIRGVLCRDCNALEGRIWNAMSRCIQPATVQERLEWVKNLISYYEKGTTDLIYPGEIPRKKISRRNFNALVKAWKKDNPKSKDLTYPKSGYITTKLEALFSQYNISPYN